MDRITEAEQRRKCNLERKKAEDPQLIREVLRLRGQWLSIKKIARLCNIAVETVTAICGQYADQLKNDHERRVQQMRGAADALIEEIVASPNSVPWSVKAPAACQLYEKSELLAGRATERIEEVQKIDIYAQWRRFVDGEETGLSGGKIPVREAELVDAVLDNEERNPVRPFTAINGPEMGFPRKKNSPENPLPEGGPANDQVTP